MYCEEKRARIELCNIIIIHLQKKAPLVAILAHVVRDCLAFNMEFDLIVRNGIIVSCKTTQMFLKELC